MRETRRKAFRDTFYWKYKGIQIKAGSPRGIRLSKNQDTLFKNIKIQRYQDLENMKIIRQHLLFKRKNYFDEIYDIRKKYFPKKNRRDRVQS